MIPVLQRWTDAFLGRGEAACTVPVFDGPLQPNQVLEGANRYFQADQPWDLASDGQQLWLADGTRLLRLTAQDTAELVLQASDRITALCAFAGGLAVAEGGRTIRIHGGAFHGIAWTEAAGKPFVSVNALAANGTQLLVSEGSAEHGPDAWQRDLMSLGHTGRVLRLSAVDGSAHVLADSLRHAFGVVAHGDAVWVSESWRHRVVALGAGDSPVPVLQQLPGYPSRLTPARDGGWWLTAFACRTQLVEFVLREPQFRQRMLQSMPPELWVVPQLRSGVSFLEPLQGGGIKQMGVLKPCAPPRSYGLVIHLDAHGQPTHSFHSRVDGHHHGVVSAVECGDALYLLSAGAGRVLRLPLEKA